MDTSHLPHGASTSRGAAGDGGPARRGWLFAAVILAAVLAQATTLVGGYALDDVPVVQRNADLDRGLGALPRIFRQPAWPGDLERQPYRPLTSTTFLVERSLAGPAPAAGLAHVVNVLLHAGVAALLLSLLLALAPGRPLLALGAAVLLAVHPLATTAVALVTGRAVLLGAFLGLLALRAWVAYRPGRENMLPLAAMFLLLALFACEALLVLPLLALALDRARWGLAPLAALRARWPGYAAWAVVVAVWLAVWLGHGPGGAVSSVPQPDVGDRLALGFEALARDALKVVLPVGYVADRSHQVVAGRGWPLVDERLLAVLLAGLAWLAALLLPLRHGAAGTLRLLLVAAGLLTLGAALTLPQGAVLEDRWGYLSLPAWALLAGLGVESLARWGSATPARRAVTRALPGVLLVALTLLSVRVAQGLADDATVHDRLIALPGGHGPALLRRAERLLRLAEEERGISARLPARHPDALQDPVRGPHVRAMQAARQAAEDLLKSAIKHPATRAAPDSWLLLGLLQLDSATPGAALETLAEARRLDPLLSGRERERLARDPSALRRAARIYAGLGRAQLTQGRPVLGADAYGEAARHERRASEASGEPPDTDLLFRAAMAVLGDQRFAEGLPLLEEVALRSQDEGLRAQAQAQLERGRQTALERVAELLARAREFQDQQAVPSATETYEEALQIDPTNLEARYWAAQLRGMHFGRYELALDYVAEGLRLLQGRAPSAEREAGRARLEELRQRLQEARARDDADSDE